MKPYEFAIDMIENRIKRVSEPDNLQIFITTVDYDRHMDKKEATKYYNRLYQQHITTIGQFAIHGISSPTQVLVGEYYHPRPVMSGTIELIGRKPRKSDKFYLEYFGDNIITTARRNLFPTELTWESTNILTRCKLVLE